MKMIPEWTSEELKSEEKIPRTEKDVFKWLEKTNLSTHGEPQPIALFLSIKC